MDRQEQSSSLHLSTKLSLQHFSWIVLQIFLLFSSGAKCVQLFLHYVDSKQSDAEQRKYDGRPRLGVDQLLRKKQKG